MYWTNCPGCNHRALDPMRYNEGELEKMSTTTLLGQRRPGGYKGLAARLTEDQALDSFMLQVRPFDRGTPPMLF